MEEVPPGIAFEGLRFRSYRDVGLVAYGEAARASFRRDTADLSAESIKVHIPARPGEPEVVLEAPRGHGNLHSHQFQVEGGIVATRAGDVARTERAWYAYGLVEGDRPVSIRGEDWDLDGPGFVLDPTSGIVRIRGGGQLVVRGVVP